MNVLKAKLAEILKLDIEYFFKNSINLTWRYIYLTGLSVIMGVVFARLVSKEVYGSYQLVMSFVATFAFFALPGFNKGIWADGTKGMDGVLDVAIKNKIKWALLGSICLIAISAKYFAGGDIILGSALLATAITFPLAKGGDIWISFLDLKKRFKLTTKLSLIFNTLSKALVILTIMVFVESLLFLVIATMSSLAIINYIGMKFAQKHQENKKYSNETKKYGFFLTKIGVLRDVLQRIDSLLIGLIMGPTYLAVYSFAKIIPDQLEGLMSSVGNVIIPKLNKNNQKEVQQKIKKNAILIIVGSIAMIVVTILLTPIVIETLFTDKYADSVLYSQIITASMTFYMFEVLVSRLLIVNKHKKHIFIVNTVIPICRSIAIVTGFIISGIMGVAIAHIVFRIIGFLVYSFAAKTSVKQI